MARPATLAATCAKVEIGGRGKAGGRKDLLLLIFDLCGLVAHPTLQVSDEMFPFGLTDQFLVPPR